jgi:acyl-CoA dehydrogenase
MGVLVTAEEREALRGEIERFTRRAIAPRVRQLDRPLGPVELAAILAEAEAVGLAGSDDAPTGLGAWEGLVDEGAPGPSLDTLVQLGGADAATAFAIHQRALARAACRLAGLSAVALAPLAIAPAGRYGLGRRPLVRWLAGAAQDPGDGVLLDDVYGSGAPRVVTVEHGFAAVVVPVRVGPSVQWLLGARERLTLEVHAHAHGLAALATASLSLPAAADVSTLAERQARTVFAAVAGAHQLAVVAIARGAVERGLQLARRYAAERYQGGAIIDRHPAVLKLLGRARGALVVVDALLDRASRTRLDPDGFVAALAVRSRAMPALADAANAALQVFGGLGYLRDVGAEKVVRDVNHLRAIAGPLGELDLMVAEWERIHA